MNVSKAERDALVGFACRAAELFPERVARVALLRDRPAPDRYFPVAVVLREPCIDPAERRAFMRVFADAARPAIEADVYLLLLACGPDDADATRGRTLWPSTRTTVDAGADMGAVELRANVHFHAWAAWSSCHWALDGAWGTEYEAAAQAAYGTLDQLLARVEVDAERASVPLRRPPIMGTTA